MELQMSLWAQDAAARIAGYDGTPVYQYQAGHFNFNIHLLDDSLWIISDWNDKSCAAFRTAFAPGGLGIDSVKQRDNGVSIVAKAATGRFTVDISLSGDSNIILHYTVKFNPAANLSIPFWPKDILILKKNDGGAETEGDIYVRQFGIRSGIIYAGIKKPGDGSFLYFQNLTAINEYCIATGTSVADTVGGEWPELGFSLPVTKNKSLPKGKEFTISDAYISFSDQTPADQFEISTRYIDHLAAIYKLIPKPDTNYQPYSRYIKFSISDLEKNKGCWSQHKGCSYLNAYVCDYQTPPEVMVQLAVLLPIWDYQEWSGEKLEFSNQLYDNLPTFYDESIGTINRWLPSQLDKLDKTEEQKSPYVMDAWYLHHPLLNLGRMALTGNKKSKDLFMRSIDYAIKVAHHFHYKWPVFYHMKTLDVIKEETQAGMGGEKDVAGVYAQVMLMAWDLTGEKRFFKEAEKAVQTLTQFGFDVFYQANNTAFSAKAILRLYKETGKSLYLDLCHLFIANLFKNLALWECEYGYGRNYPLFFGLFPLNDAPYLAVYEEQESFAAIHDLLAMAEGTPLSANARLLLAEYTKYMINRAAFYCPPILPKEMLSDDVKTGEIDPKLWVAVEDLHDGWEKAGKVGQEVYGAGLCFGIVPRHYIKIPGQQFMVFLDYPAGKKQIRGKTLRLEIFGSKEMPCTLRIVSTNEAATLPEFSFTAENKQDEKGMNKYVAGPADHDFRLHGGQTVIIKWNDRT